MPMMSCRTIGSSFNPLSWESLFAWAYSLAVKRRVRYYIFFIMKDMQEMRCFKKPILPSSFLTIENETIDCVIKFSLSILIPQL